MPHISVIMPTYNRAHLISRAVDSLLAQTYQDFEIIIVDDGSTDNTREVLVGYGERITYYFQENAGPSRARNRGIQSAQGELLAFLDSDDTLSPNKLELQVAYLAAHPEVQVVYCGWQVISEDGITVENEVRPAPEEDILKGLLLRTYLFPIHAALIRHACVDRVGLFDETLPAFEDPDFWMRIAKAGYKFACIEEPLCQWRITSNSLGKDQTKLEQGTPVVLKKIFDDPHLPAEIRVIKDEVYARHYLAFGLNYYYAANGDKTSREHNVAQKYLNIAVTLKPNLLEKKPHLLDMIIYKAIERNPNKPEMLLHTTINTLLANVGNRKRLQSRLLGRLHIILAFRFQKKGHHSGVVTNIMKGVRYDPTWLKNRGLLSLLVKSMKAQFERYFSPRLTMLFGLIWWVIENGCDHFYLAGYM